MKIRFIERLNPSVLLGLCFIILVLVFSQATIDPVLVPRYIFTVGTLLVLMAIFALQKRALGHAIHFLKDKAALPFYLFLAASCCSMLNAIALNEAIFTLSNYLLFFILLLVMLVAFNGEMINMLNAAKGIIVGGIVISAIGFYQLYAMAPSFPVPMEDLYEIKSTLGHKNLFTSASLLTFFFALYGVFNLPKIWKVVSVLAALSSLGTVLILQTRSALVALIVGNLALGGIILISKFLPRLAHGISIKMLWWASALMFIIFSVLYSLPEKTFDTQFLSASIQDQDDRSFTIKERSLLWESTAQMALSESFLGVGPANWKIHFPFYGSGIWRARQGMVQFQRPHNDYLWVLSESGIFGLVGYLMIFGTILFIGFKAQLLSTNSQERWLLRFAMVTIISYMVVAVFSFPRERIVHQWLLTFSFAFILSVYLKSKKEEIKKWPLLIAFGLLLLPMMWIGVDRYRGEKLSARMLNHRETESWNALLNDFKEVKKLHFYDMDPISMPVTFYAGLAELSLKNYDASLGYFNEAYKMHPYNIHVINNLGGIHQLRKEYDVAIFYYQRVVKVAPYYKDGILNLSAAYFNNNQALEAYAVLLANHDKFEANEPAYFYYLLFELRTILLNLSETEKYRHLFFTGRALSDDWLLGCHNAAIATGLGIEEIMVENITESDN